MASTSVLKLSVDDREYNASLKQAAQGMKHLEQTLQESGRSFSQAGNSVVEYVQGIGNMETRSKTARGEINEMTSAFIELSKIYNKMSDEAKQGDVGKALSQSLDQLRQRTQEAKAQFETATQSLNDNGKQTGGMLEALASKFTINIDAMKLFSMGLKTANVALDVAKDAFFASEASVDEWGRTMQASQSLYEGFLSAINNGDISGFLSRMDEIVRAARDAYNELDKLGSMKTIQAPKISAQQTENDRLRNMIRTGRYIAPIDGRSNAVFNGRVMQSGDKLTAGQIRGLEKQLQNGMNNVVKLVGNEVKQTGKAINAYYNQIAKQNGISLQEFKKGTSSWEEFSKKLQGYEDYKRWDAQARTEFAKQGGRGAVDFDKNNPYAEFRRWGNFRVDKMGKNSFNDLVGLIRQRDQQAGQAYNMQSQAYRTMNRAEGFTVNKLMGNGGGGGGRAVGSTTTNEVTYAADSIAAQEKLVSELTKKWREAGASVRDDYKAQLDEAKTKLQEMTNPSAPVMKIDPTQIGTPGSVTGYENIFDGMKEGVTSVISPLQALNDELKRLQEGQALALTPEQWQIWQEAIDKTKKKISDFTGGGKEGEKSWKNAATAVQAVGSAMQGIEDPAAKVMGTIGQAIASIALGFAQATTAESGKGVWAWIAAVAGGLATMLSTISAIHSATGYAQGGIVDGRGGGFVPGSSFSGDNLGNVMLNSGELVLNQSQQNNLANALTGNPMSSMRLSAVVSGEQILLVANRTTRRQGRGELVTFR